MLDVLPIVLVVAFWMLLGVICFAFFARMLRLPTEAEIEAAHEEAMEAAEAPAH